MCAGQFLLWNHEVLNPYALEFLNALAQVLVLLVAILIVVLCFVSPYWPSPRGREKQALKDLERLEKLIREYKDEVEKTEREYQQQKQKAIRDNRA